MKASVVLKKSIQFTLLKAITIMGLVLCFGLIAGCSDTGSVESSSSDSTAQNKTSANAVTLADTTASADSAAVEALYNKSCIACHISGAAGAPRTGDKAEWQRRTDEKGIEGLIDAVVNGVGSMPPTGLCSQCTREDYRSLILFMAE